MGVCVRVLPKLYFVQHLKQGEVQVRPTPQVTEFSHIKHIHANVHNKSLIKKLMDSVHWNTLFWKDTGSVEFVLTA